MTYDTGLRHPKFYRKLIHDWTADVLAWSEGKPVLIGIPSYEDEDTTYHKPGVENITMPWPASTPPCRPIQSCRIISAALPSTATGK